MNTEFKSVHFNLGEGTKEYLEKKLERIDFAKEYIIDLLFTFTKEKNRFILEVTINFRWNHSGHIKVKDYDLVEGIDVLMDKLEKKVRREKEKVKEHKGEKIKE